MKNENMRRVLLNRNMNAAPRYQIQSNENNKNKENIVSSQKIINKNNHVHYYSKSSNRSNNNTNSKKDLKLSKKLSYNDEKNNEEEIDHPKPLLSDIEEDLDDLKAQFIKKNVDKEILNKDKNNNLYFENIKKNNNTMDILDTKNKILIEENTKEKDNNINNEKVLNKKKSEIYFPLKKSYKSENLCLDHIKPQLSVNFIDNDKKDYNIKKIKRNEQIFMSNRSKKELNNNRKTLCQNSSFNLLNEKTTKKNKPEKRNENKVRNENYNYLNIPNNNKKINKKSPINKSVSIINNNQKQYLYTSNIPKVKRKYGNLQIESIIKEECERNHSQEKTNSLIHNRMTNIPQNQQKNITSRSTIPIILKNINNSLPNEEIRSFASDRDYEYSSNVLDEFSKNNTEENNVHNLSRIKSNDLKKTDFQKRHNIFMNNKEDDHNNTSRYRKKTYEKGGKFHNVQTTYIVISKKPNINKIPKSSNNPEIVDYNKYKFINPTPSANYLNNSKLNNVANISSNYPNEYEYQRKSVNEIRRVGSNNNFKNLPIRRSYNYNDFILDNNNYDTNYRNYIESSIIRNGDLYKDIKGRNTCYLINKSSSINQNTMSNYDYDYKYDYFYNYDDNFTNNSYFHYNTNANY